MLSERLFSRSYSSFWRDLLPFSEAFVRGVNEHWGAPPDDPFAADSITMAIVNEGAVQLFRMVQEGGGRTEDDAAESLRAAARFLNISDFSLPLWAAENAREMADRLVAQYGASSIEFSPPFPGCGFLSACRGDFRMESTLVEVKGGHRTFRSADFRQLITYLALNHAAPRYQFDSVSLCNPRLARVVDMSIDDLCVQMGGCGPVEIFSTLIEFVTNVNISDA
jgi:hypothetical protein